MGSYRDSFPSQYEERFRSLRQEPCKLVNKNVLNLIRLLYPYADPDTID